jgi:SAM-dependent methyltransferase
MEFVLSGLSAPGKALDLGCGEGRDSIFLARHGYHVTSVDRSDAGIAKLAAFAKREGLSISAMVGDVATFSIAPCAYDLISLVTVLDHLEPQESELVAKRVCEGLRPGGIAFVEVFTTMDPGFAGGPQVSETAGFVRNFFEPGALKRVFASLEVLRYEEKDELDDTHGPVHRHNVAILLGRKVHG